MSHEVVPSPLRTGIRPCGIIQHESHDEKFSVPGDGTDGSMTFKTLLYVRAMTEAMPPSREFHSADWREADPDTLLRLFRTVSLIRAFDDLSMNVIAKGEAYFIHYPVRGHEIIAAASGEVLAKDDYMTVTYRGTADSIAKGVPLRELWGEMLGRESGTSRGRGGPMHFSDPEHGLMLCTGIVGAGMPIANGLALASKLRGDGRVTLTNFGDGASNIGAFHEALNMASIWDLPVVFLCQNNYYGEHTRFEDAGRNPAVVDRAYSYAMRGIRVLGADPVSMTDALRLAVDHARGGHGPVLVEAATFRTLGHVHSDKNEYMDPAVLERHLKKDPVPLFRERLLEELAFPLDTITQIELDAKAAVREAYESAKSDPAAKVIDFAAENATACAPGIEPDTDDRAVMTFRNAITSALDIALAADPNVFLIGEDIADSAGGGVFHVTEGLSTRYGEHRVRNTPIAEEAIMGAAVGAALAGMRPVPEIMFMDFMWVAFDQLANHAAKLRFMSGGRTPVPLTLRVSMMGGTAIGAQHSQSLEAILMQTPGLKVVMPSNPYDAKGLLLACIEDDDPCVFIESNALFARKAPVPAGHYTIPLGVAAVRQAGDDITIVTYGRLVHEAEKAAVLLSSEGISAEVIDLRTLAPLDIDTVAASVARTGRALVVHEAVRTCGAGAEIAAQLHHRLPNELRVPVERLTAPDSSVPGPAGLVADFYPTAARIVETARAMFVAAPAS